MQQLLVALPLLACPIMMGLMMWFMMRGKESSNPPAERPDPRADEIARLRAELDQVKALASERLSARDSDHTTDRSVEP